MSILLARPESPPPSPEQIANAAKWGLDAWDVVGLSRWWALPKSRLNPAAVIHDELFLYQLDYSEKEAVNYCFMRDARILAEADGSTIEAIEVRAFEAVVFAVSPFIDTSVDRNTEVTRAQGIARMNVAKQQINDACKACNVAPYYPEVEPSEERYEPPY